MALDTLQIPATVINNDKLVSMYGNLLAKKKSEEDAYQKGLIDQMAKIDAAGIRTRDVEDYNKMYNQYVSFGTDNIKSLSEPSVQVKLKQMENQLKGFINLSKAEKEKDIQVLHFGDPTKYDKSTVSAVQSYVDMPTLQRNGDFDRMQIKAVDDKDYISSWKIDPKEIIVKGNTRYTNPVDAYPTILKNIEENVIARANTLDGQKALAQYAVKANFDLSTPEGTDKAIKGLAKTLFDINKVNFDKAITDFGTQDKVTIEEQSAAIGYDIKKEKQYESRVIQNYEIFRGNKNATDSLKNSFPGATITNSGDEFKIVIPEYKDKNNNVQPAVTFSILKNIGAKAFILEVNKVQELLGERRGLTSINREVLDVFLKNPKFSKYTKNPDWNQNYPKQVAKAKAKGKNGSVPAVKATQGVESVNDSL